MPGSNPGWTTGYVPPASEWNTWWGNKADFGIITQQPISGHFFVQDGAVVDRFNDRIFMGGATLNDGAFPNIIMDWLQAFLASSTGGSEVGPMVGSQVAVLSTIGQFAFTAGSRTSDNPTAGSENTVGIAAFGINDNTTAASTAWAYYGEARRLAGVNELTFGMELDVANQGSFIQNTPYLQSPGATVGIQLASGCGVALPGNANTSVGLQFEFNQTSFDKGIVFGATSIAGTDGVTAGESGTAIAFAAGHSIKWFCLESGASNEANTITGTTLASANATHISFSDQGILFTNSTNTMMAMTPGNPGTGNTAMELLVNSTAGLTLALVTLGSPNSGGTGFRTLVVPN